MSSRGERIAVGILAIVAIVAVVVLLAWRTADRNNQLNDFRGDVAAMGFQIMDAEWDDEEQGSALEARVEVSDCWLVELTRKSGEDDVLTNVNGRVIEMLRFDEVHLVPSLIGNDEPDVDDFTDALSVVNVEKYMQAHTYPCRKDLGLAG